MSERGVGCGPLSTTDYGAELSIGRFERGDPAQCRDLTEPSSYAAGVIASSMGSRPVRDLTRAVLPIQPPPHTQPKAVPTLHRCAEMGRMHVHHGALPHPELPRF